MTELRRCGPQEVGCSDADRFIQELEFVQCLANPNYLNWLAQNRCFDDPAFINYLKYLLYFKQPQYAKYIQYPHCLFFLDMLQTEDFRKAVVKTNVTEFIHTQQFRFWQTYASERLKELAPQGQQQQGQGQEQQPAVA